MVKKESTLLLATKYYGGDVEKTILMEKLIDECLVCEFKLTDQEFMRIIAEHGYSEETEGVVMDMMVRVPEDRGTFMRVSDGWIFTEVEEDPGDYAGKLFFNADGTLDERFIGMLAD